MKGDDRDPDGYELWQNEVGAWKLYEETDPNWPWADGINHMVQCILKGNVRSSAQNTHTMCLRSWRRPAWRVATVRRDHREYLSRPDFHIRTQDANGPSASRPGELRR